MGQRAEFVGVLLAAWIRAADHRFDGAFASPVDGFAYRCLELVGHLDQRAGVLRRRIRQWRETLLRARDDGDHGPSRCRVQSRAWHTQSRWRTKLAEAWS